MLPIYSTRVAGGLNFCFFIAVPSDGEQCWCYIKCEMVLRKIDGEMNMQNCGYSTKLWNGDGGDWCSTADGNGSYHELAPLFFKEMTRCRRQKHHWRWPGNPNGRWKYGKYRIYQFYFSEIATNAPQLMATAVAMDRAIVFEKDDMLPMLKTSSEMTKQP